jgi:hypothetical protein
VLAEAISEGKAEAEGGVAQSEFVEEAGVEQAPEA